MKAKWFIEHTNYDEEYLKIVEEVVNQGYEYELVKREPNFKTSFSDCDCIVPQCTINMAQQIKDQHNWVPGVWLNSEAYECTEYYKHFEEYLFNSDYEFMTVRDLLANRAEVLESHAVDGDVFIRPDSGLKSFTGTMLPLTETSFHFNWVWIENYVTPDTIVVVSSPKDIMYEWRFIAAEGKILTGSMYSPMEENSFPRPVFELAKLIAESGYDPDLVWSIDICQGVDGEYKLLEIGCFSCCGLYACDLEPIVKTVSEIAERVWIENNKE